MEGQLRLELSEDGADAERVDELTGYLRGELLQLDVDDVTALRAGEAPPGARVFDVLAVGGLLIDLGRSERLRAVVNAVKGWLSRGNDARRTVKLEIDGDVLELSGADEADQDRLITLFVERHSSGQAGRS